MNITFTLWKRVTTDNLFTATLVINSHYCGGILVGRNKVVID